MHRPAPQPISEAARQAREDRVGRIARDLGFVGQYEYKHVYRQSGGAQYGQGTTIAKDLLTVYCEAFERDADPEDFSVEAMIAHERGHQLLLRHPRIAPRVTAGFRCQRGDSRIPAGGIALHVKQGSKRVIR